MEALPIVLDHLLHPVTAVIISVTAVLFFGEIIPQAICSKHGLLIGRLMAWPVRILMLLTFPISWPISKLLDFVLGGEHSTLFRRSQLKALVSIHGHDEGFGGRLSKDEISIINGALDLTRKKAFMSMTPINKVFMLSTDQILDQATIDLMMSSKPYSRLPIYRGDDKKDILGLILVKEVLEYVTKYPNSLVSSLRIRPLPHLSASTPMYELLKLFRTGRAHMALLTQPLDDENGHQDDQGLDGNSPLLGAAGNTSHMPKQPSTPSKQVKLSALPPAELEMELQRRQERSPDRPLIDIDGHSTRDTIIDIKAEIDNSQALAGAPSPFGGIRTQISGLFGQGNASLIGGTDVASARGSDGDDDIDEMVPVPLIAKPGEPIGIITIEDVIEELMGFEVLDETDRFVDNEQMVTVEEARSEGDLTEAMKVVMALAERAMSAVVKTLNFAHHESSPRDGKKSTCAENRDLERRSAILHAAAIKKVSSSRMSVD